MTDAQRVFIQDNVDSTLQFLWNHNNVTVEHQHAFARAGCSSIKVFKGLAASDDDMRYCLSNDLGLVPSSMGARVAIANIIGAWSAAWDRVDADNKVKAEARASGGLQPASVLEFQAMAAAYKTTVLKGEKLEQNERPSKSYLGKKLQEVEEGELETETLEEVTSKGDGEEPDSMLESYDTSGKRRITRKAKKIALPRDVPELQQRHRVMAHCLGYLKTKQVSVSWLQSTSLSLWEGFTRFLSGERVYNLKVTLDANGKRQPPRPDWSLILHYERELRKKANELIQEEHMDIASALNQAMKDSELRDIHFVTPYLAAISCSGQPPSQDVGAGMTTDARYQPYQQYYKGKKGDPKGKGKGLNSKGKGDGKWGVQMGRLANVTPGGLKICFNFNKKGGTPCPDTCTFEHVCRIQGCFKSTCQAFRCPMAPRAIKQQLGGGD